MRPRQKYKNCLRVNKRLLLKILKTYAKIYVKFLRYSTGAYLKELNYMPVWMKKQKKFKNRILLIFGKQSMKWRAFLVESSSFLLNQKQGILFLTILNLCLSIYWIVILVLSFFKLRQNFKIGMLIQW